MARKSNRIAAFQGTALGKKVVMAATGFLLAGFVLIHMAGNLKLYLGAEAMNHYGEWLRTVGSPLLPPTGALWIARLVLLAAVVLHIASATALTLQSRAARPQSYDRSQYAIASYASRTMRWGGVIVLLFIIWHLLDLTFGSVNPSFTAGRPYENVVASFSNPIVAGFYVIANILLGLHLRHGLWSMFQSLGWWQSADSGADEPRWDARQIFAAGFSWLVVVGNVSFPIAVVAGWVR